MQPCCTINNTPIQTVTNFLSSNSLRTTFLGPQSIAFNPTNTCCLISDAREPLGYVYMAPVNPDGTIDTTAFINILPPPPNATFVKPQSAVFSVDGNWIIIADATIDANGAVFVYQYFGCSTQPMYHSTLPTPLGIGSRGVFSANVSPDGNALIETYNGELFSGVIALFQITSYAPFTAVPTQTISTLGCGSCFNPTESSFFSPDNKYVVTGVSQSNASPPRTEAQFYSVNTATATFNSMIPVLSYIALTPAQANVTFASVSFAPNAITPSQSCFTYALNLPNADQVTTLTYDGTGALPVLTNPTTISFAIDSPEQANYTSDGQLLGVANEGTTASTRAVYIFGRTFTFDAIVTPVPCNGTSVGAITVMNVVNGNPPYTYSLNNNPVFGASNTFTGLAAGSYYISVRDSQNCITTKYPVIVPQTVAEVPISPAFQNVCTGQSIVLTALPTGQTGPYVFMWTGPNGFTQNTGNNPVLTILNSTSTNTGDYTVMVTDSAGCQATSAPSSVFVGSSTCNT